MFISAALTLAIVLGIYGLVIAALAWTLRRLGVPGTRAILSGFLAYGFATGILAVALWPMDTSVYPNVLAAWGGDWIYVKAIEFIGDPHSDQAHSTIPWLLRVPQVYALASTALCGGLGIAAQWLYNRSQGRGTKQQSKLRNAER
jgi:hypothetical protein